MLHQSKMTNRTAFTASDIVAEIWTHLDLPPSALPSLHLPGATEKPVVRSSFKIGLLAQSTIALSALSAAVAHSILCVRLDSDPEQKEEDKDQKEVKGVNTPRTTVPLRHAVLEFQCEKLYTLSGAPPAESWGPIGGLHPTVDGHVRIHDNFPHHRAGALALLGLDETCRDRAAVAERTRGWKSADLERVGVEETGLAIYALRNYGEWDALPQAGAVGDFPVSVRRVGTSLSSSGYGYRRCGLNASSPKCLSGLRVLEFSRVIAAPVAGKTLAAHGADVLWVTCPRLPDIPGLDREFSRGKKSVCLDLDVSEDKEKVLRLVRDADVVIQGYRPGSLAARGLDVQDLAKINPGIIVANLSAFGPDGEWKDRRGYDSLVQTASGMNVSEAEHYGQGEVAKALPCQALDHSAGFLLAAGVCAALYHREKDRREGRRVGAYVVDVSLAGVMKYLKSLGQYEGRSGFEGEDLMVLGAPGERNKEEEAFFETRPTVFGEMTFLRHSASVEGFETGWDTMPMSLGSGEASWSGL
ncbi:CoA-transferase family III [Xylaria bambusicola]|uniref:CoA-transferase family III n=1 Tax=Xylaria bambusicola TaxID=326684 RepID=UPI0020081CF5|nr:CoA-transferase family III [Xylaria bambusicola]KAI0521701.1 CoA-transferase family III [Xylaria bambusicola]